MSRHPSAKPSPDGLPPEYQTPKRPDMRAEAERYSVLHAVSVASVPTHVGRCGVPMRGSVSRAGRLSLCAGSLSWAARVLWLANLAAISISWLISALVSNPSPAGDHLVSISALSLSLACSSAVCGGGGWGPSLRGGRVSGLRPPLAAAPSVHPMRPRSLLLVVDETALCLRAAGSLAQRRCFCASSLRRTPLHRHLLRRSAGTRRPSHEEP